MLQLSDGCMGERSEYRNVLVAAQVLCYDYGRLWQRLALDLCQRRQGFDDAMCIRLADNLQRKLEVGTACLT